MMKISSTLFVLLAAVVCAAAAPTPHTVFQFKRKLDTCDNQDVPISDTGTSRVIWAYNDADPTTPNPPVHDKRGSKTLSLTGKSKIPAKPTDAQYFDQRVNVNISSGVQYGYDAATTYWCKPYVIPTALMANKRHVIQVDTLNTSPGKLHHILWYECPTAFTPAELAFEGACGDANMPASLSSCNTGRPVTAWAIGGDSFVFPPEAGYPIGGAIGVKYGLMEFHYDNYDGVPFTDTSGLRIWYTPTLRQYDAGILWFGGVSGINIPAGSPNHITKTWCPGGCTNKLPNGGVNVFASFLHAHKAGIAIKGRHIRNGTELTPLGSEPFYDFDYQQFVAKQRPFPTIQPGDEIQVDCVFNTVGRTNATVGGLASDNEMCLMFAAYYPRVDMENCIYVNLGAGGALVPFGTGQGYASCPGGAGAPGAVLDQASVFSSYTPYAPTCVASPPTAAAATPSISASEFDFTAYDHSEFLDTEQKFHLFWKYLAFTNEIMFAVDVATQGWVGFGLSPTGGMAGADVAIMWVDGTTAHFKDRFATAKVMPAVDTVQDYFDIQGYQKVQTEDTTVMEWKRQMDTCDSSEDVAIVEGTQRVIYAYSNGDPTTANPQKHDQRGSQSVVLAGVANVPALEPDTQSFDLKVSGVNVSTQRTTYWCEAFDIPTSLQNMKRHINKVAVVNDSPGKLHHIVWYECNTLSAADRAYKGSCFDASMPPGLTACNAGTPIAVWAIGGTDFYFPPEAGFPMGLGDLNHTMMEFHYDNYDGIPFTDTSGLRVSYTPTLRQHDAGVIWTGAVAGISVPPNTPNHITKTWCPAGCTNKLPSAGVKVFATFMHAHLIGRALFGRIIRNGTEQTLVGNEPYYDFNYQNFINHKRPFPTIQPGDQLEVRCNYNSQGRTTTTVGGAGSNEEMCLMYNAYYPRQAMSACIYMNLGAGGAQVPLGTGQPYAHCPTAAAPAGVVISAASQFQYTPKPKPPCNSALPAGARTTPVLATGPFYPTLYDHSSALDSNFRLFWRYDPEAGAIAFAAEVKTRGWVGFGMSRQGGMDGADIALGWVDDTSRAVSVADRFASSRSMPTVDSSQNIYDVTMRQTTANVGGGGSGGGTTPPTASTVPGFTKQLSLAPTLSVHWGPAAAGAFGTKFRLEYAGNGWLSLGVSLAKPGMSAMAGPPASGAVIASTASSGNGMLAADEYTITAQSLAGITSFAPPNGKSGVTGVSVSQSGGSTVLEFTCPNAIAGAKLAPPGKLTTLMWAVGTGNMLNYHGANRGTTKVDLGSGKAVPQPGASSMHITHGILMTVGTLLLCAGVLFPLMFSQGMVRDNWWRAKHFQYQGTGLTLIVFGFILAVAMVPRDHLLSGHSKLGVAVFGLLMLQALIALPRACSATAFEGKMAIFRGVHRFLGTCSLILAAVNIILGGTMMARHFKMPVVGYGLLAVFGAGLLLICLLAFTRCCGRMEKRQRGGSHSAIEMGAPAAGGTSV